MLPQIGEYVTYSVFSEIGNLDSDEEWYINKS